MSILREQDLRQIEQTLYTPKENELVARKILRVNTNYNKFASSVGYHWYSRKGSAKIFASGASAKDVPFVGEDGGEMEESGFHGWAASNPSPRAFATPECPATAPPHGFIAGMK